MRRADVDRMESGHSDLSDSTFPWLNSNLIDLKLEFTGITGELPGLNFSKFADCGWDECCSLEGNRYRKNSSPL